MSGLPALQFDAVVAHELTHVWMRLLGVRPPARIEEGVAQLTAYWLLMRRPHPLAAVLRRQIAESPDYLYGTGFRVARAAEALFGWDRVVDSLMRTQSLPA